MTVDLGQVAALIAEAAAAEIAPRFGRLQPDEVREKGPNDLVTVADLAMERVLSAALPDLVPGSVVVGEEAASADATVLDRLAAHDWVWVIDPVDGTSNFAAGRPVIAVIVALVHRGETVAGWIHDPLAASTALAERGRGAWRDGRRLTVAQPVPPALMDGSLNGRFFPGSRRRYLEDQRGHFRSIKPLFCAGQEYLLMAAGRRHFALFGRLKPWDHAAGVLLHAEAGGYSARLDGTPYRPDGPPTGGLLMAPDAASWQAVHDILFAPAEDAEP